MSSFPFLSPSLPIYPPSLLQIDSLFLVNCFCMNICIYSWIAPVRSLQCYLCVYFQGWLALDSRLVCGLPSMPIALWAGLEPMGLSFVHFGTSIVGLVQLTFPQFCWWDFTRAASDFLWGSSDRRYSLGHRNSLISILVFLPLFPGWTLDVFRGDV